MDVLCANGDRVTVVHVTLGVRLRAAARSEALDALLACGTSPDATPGLAARARRLLRLSQRRMLARRIMALLAESRSTPTAWHLTRGLPLRHREILASSDDLIDLAGLLGSGQPVSACGIAYCRRLLTDGHGPFYGFGARPPLSQAISHARALLDPYAELA